MVRKFTKQRLNPLKIIKKNKWPSAHITFNPKLKAADADCSIIKGCKHDGTMIFSQEMFAKALIPLVCMQIAPENNLPDMERLKGIKYEIGYLNLASVFGKIQMAFGKIDGVRERIRIPVKCEYIYK